MKLSVLSLLLLAGSTSAQYYSAGWTPGQKAPEPEPQVAAFIPGQPLQGSPSHAEGPAGATPPPSAGTLKPFSFMSLFDMKNILTSGPAVALFDRFGVNITERVGLADKLWDDRVTLITDQNYQDVIVNEEMTPEEEKERIWVIIVSAQAAKQDEINKHIDNVFDSAFNQTQHAGDLPHVKWGRIDYNDVTYLTTKWAVWRAPYLIVITDRGQSLRFYHHYQLRFREENIRFFLKEKQYLLTPPWSTSFAPGGEYEYIMDFAATWLTKSYNVVVLLPKWLLLMISGGIGTLIIGLMHRPSKNQAQAKQPAIQTAESSKAAEKRGPSQPQVQKQSSKQKGKAKEVHPATPALATSSAQQPKPTVPAPVGTKPPSPRPVPVTPAKQEPLVAPLLPKPVTNTPGTTDSERESSAPPTGKRSARQRKTNKKA